MNILALESVLSAKNLFLVFTKDKKKLFILAKDEEDLPVNISDVAFAASLVEMKALVEEMEKVMTLSVDERDGVIVLHTNDKESSNDN